MIWNSRFLFLHYPKVAGKSLTEYFVRAWEPPIHGIVARGQRVELERIRDGLHLETGHSHQNAIAARTVLERRGIDIRGLEAIFLAVRLPYDLAYSTYRYLRANHAAAADRPAFALAARSTFPEFLERFKPSPFERWMAVDGRDLGNLSVLRFEHLREDIEAAARKFGFAPVELGHINATARDTYEAHMTSALEPLVYANYRELFARGWYQRQQFGESASC